MQEDLLKDIRRRCRLAMNGMASASMRNMGLDYKLNFGLVVQQIKELATSYTPDAELAESLWKEGTRELKILATMLYPQSEFTSCVADRWVTEIPNQEIREQICVNLLQELDFALNIAIQWSNSTDDKTRTTGYWLLARLLLSKKNRETIYIASLPAIWTDILSDDLFLRNASMLAIKHIGRQSKDIADAIINKLAPLQNDANPINQEIYNNISFEFEFFWGE